MQRAQVLDGELSLKTRGELTEETSGGCRQDDVVNIEQQVGSVGALMINEERGIRAGGAKSELMEERRNALIPSTRSLLESVQGPREQADVVGMCWINEPRGLLAEDLLLEVTMKKGVGDVHLVHGPSTGYRKVENRAY